MKKIERIAKKIATPWKLPPSRNSSPSAGVDAGLYDAVAKWDLTKMARLKKTVCVYSGFYSDVHRGTTRLGGDIRTEVAIKDLRFPGPDSGILSEKYYKRFYSEILIWSQLNHPNIARLIGFTKQDHPDDIPTIVSQWYKNGNIVDWLKDNFSTDRMILLRDIICAVEYLHSQSIVHGDIKGENVLVDDLQNPRLCDFGLSHFINEYPRDITISALISSACMGATLRFSSPELLDTGRSTVVSDLWALGCLAIQILTDQIPYGGLNNASHINQNIVFGQPPFDIDTFAPRNDLERQLLQIISTCWAENPNHRPSASQFLRSIDGLIERGLQVTALLPTRGSL